MSHATIDTPLGPIGLRWEGDTLTGIELEPTPASEPDAVPPEPFAVQLARYFEDGHRPFDLRVQLSGTPFQRRVWAMLCEIPAGETRSYGEVARRLASAPRAVGQACRANPCPIVVPCHRVVGAQGLGGFAGDTSGRRLATKRWLLRHEGAAVAFTGHG